jgi:Transglutaminase-like superfamily
VSPICVASVAQVVAEIVQQVYIHRHQSGDRDGAERLAEQALERLLSRGLPRETGPHGELLLDPYLAMNSLKARPGEARGEAWRDWVDASRVNATSLPLEPHRYRLTIDRQWRLPPLPANRPVVLRLPLPIRGALRGTPEVRLLEPEAVPFVRRDEAGRVELRLDPALVRGRARVEMKVEFVSGESFQVDEPGQVELSAEERQIWLKPSEGLIAPSEKLRALAGTLPGGPPRQTADAAFDHLLSVLRLGDLHRDHLASDDPLGGLLDSAWVDCALAANLFVALCRARGIPARMVSGFLLHRAFPAPHFWAEARLGGEGWVPYDLGGWDYCEGDSADPHWGGFFRGRVDARFLAEVAPRGFTGWGSARPPNRWYRTFAPCEGGVDHVLHELPSREPFQADRLSLELLGPEAHSS